MKRKATTKKKKAAKPRRRSSSSIRLSSTVEADARKYGFKKKKPKKPASKTIASLEGYLRKVDTWKREQADAAKKYRHLQTLKKRVASM